MQDNILEFNKKTRLLNKDIAIYEDIEKGIIFPLNTINTLARVEYIEADKKQYELLKFQKKIDDLEYNIINIKRPVPKNEITGKEEDKLTLVDNEVAVRQIWNVSNTIGVYKSFTNKEEAIELVKTINENVLKFII